jgi:hypothetical protein
MVVARGLMEIPHYEVSGAKVSLIIDVASNAPKGGRKGRLQAFDALI